MLAVSDSGLKMTRQWLFVTEHRAYRKRKDADKVNWLKGGQQTCWVLMELRAVDSEFNLQVSNCKVK